MDLALHGSSRGYHDRALDDLGSGRRQRVVRGFPDDDLRAQKVVGGFPDGDLRVQKAVGGSPDGDLQAQKVVREFPDGDLQAQKAVGGSPDGDLHAQVLIRGFLTVIGPEHDRLWLKRCEMTYNTPQAIATAVCLPTE